MTTNPSPPPRRPWLGWTIFTLGLLLVGLWNLDGPQMWWDEGWTLSVARHWAEQGHYGRLRLDEPVTAGLSASYTTTLPVGISMRIFGVGLWQGRLFGVFCSVGVVLLLAALAQQLYGRGAAVATTFVALAMTMHPQIHPILQGRQVLAEMPMLLYLLAGYLCLALSLSGRWWGLAPAALCLGTAWISKGQTMPFLVASLLVPLLVALFARRWRVAGGFALALIGSYAVAQSWPLLATLFLFNPNLPAEPVEGLLAVVAVVLTPFHRMFALRNMLLFGLPTLLGLAWGLWLLWREREQARVDDLDAAGWYMHLALLAFVGSWVAWFLVFSVGVPRYMATPVVVASMLVAELLRALTAGFQFGVSMERLIQLLTLRHPSWAGGGALLALFFVAAAMSFTGLTFVRFYAEDERAAQRVANALNALPDDTRIETYESELHFLLEHPYHFPQDQIHVDLNYRSLLGEQVEINYDPLVADPAYLVVGRFTRDNQLYEPILATDAFALAWEDGVYAVYRRVRERGRG
ncbi:MAG: hypothetical protein EI684_06435 [Candidatus Viridilinea halotolerans]|uniref:Glycosyltransferase RgtA/B/C/D-like domain-containing protein n=1 Tax=Candidatus Viridilinea halotolerans TaxID=2491704 RepID=A0A426U489_9CHLR|nr:MAG: hypothetical protein EI684_06435 [Candidatus Viridilinea halotolerans]